MSRDAHRSSNRDFLISPNRDRITGPVGEWSAIVLYSNWAGAWAGQLPFLSPDTTGPPFDPGPIIDTQRYRRAVVKKTEVSGGITRAQTNDEILFPADGFEPLTVNLSSSGNLALFNQGILSTTRPTQTPTRVVIVQVTTSGSQITTDYEIFDPEPLQNQIENTYEWLAELTTFPTGRPTRIIGPDTFTDGFYQARYITRGVLGPEFVDLQESGYTGIATDPANQTPAFPAFATAFFGVPKLLAASQPSSPIALSHGTYSVPYVTVILGKYLVKESAPKVMVATGPCDITSADDTMVSFTKTTEVSCAVLPLTGGVLQPPDDSLIEPTVTGFKAVFALAFPPTRYQTAVFGAPGPSCAPEAVIP